MARVKRDRGQLLIITALLLAILFVGLALILNSGIYTENLSTRETGGSMEPLTNDPATVNRLSASMRTANYYNDTVDYGPRRAMIRRNVSAWKHRQANVSAQHGQYISTEVTGMQNGTRVSQEEYDDFMPRDPTVIDEMMDTRLDPFGVTDRTSWLVAPNVKTRAFNMSVKRESLQTVDGDLLDEFSDLMNTLLTGSDTFWTQFDDGTSVWRVYVVHISGTNDVATVITENDGSENVVGTCRVEGSTVNVRLDANELVGSSTTQSCPALSFTDDLDRHNVYYAGADDVNGTYDFIVDREETDFRSTVNTEYDNVISTLFGVIDCLLKPYFCPPVIYDDDPSGGEPYTAPAVYDTSVKTTYQTDRMTYTRNVTIEPSPTETS